MKKLLSLLVSALVVLSLVGCAIASPNPSDSPKHYKHNDFTADEKALLAQYLGDVIPFVPNDQYSLTGYHTPNGYEEGFHFYTTGSTAEDFLTYQASFTAYELQNTYSDNNGTTWYCYAKDGIIIDIAYYTNKNVGSIDVYARLDATDEPTTPDPEPTGPNTDPTTPEIDHLYKDWTQDDKALFTQYIGALIPFLPNSEYAIEGYYGVDDYENGLCFYTFGNTEAEFEAYLTKYADYTYENALPDEQGIVWHDFVKNDVVVSLAYVEKNGIRSVYVYVFSDLSQDPDIGNDKNVITNDGKGLPEDSDGVFDVNFKDATNVKDVHDQGYYLDGCPTIGSPAVLVVPIGFSDGTQLNPTHIENLEIAFGEKGNYYYSVDNFYKLSSYGKLDLDVMVLDDWYVPAYASTYYADLVDDEGIPNGDQVLMDEILQYLAGIMDLTDFDSDGNRIIDAVVLINNLDVGDGSDDFHWAYRYWNMYVDEDGYYYEYDDVSANDYVWASYFFLHESYVGNDILYNDMSVMNTYTYIHEFGHILGADDYYDTSDLNNHPMDGCDIMDYMLGDHNAYTKFNLGWLTTSRLVVTDSSVTLTLEDFSKNGDTIIIANNWDPDLGAYQEYYIVVYYTNNGLNAGDYGYFAQNGIVVYHVNASLFTEEYEGELYYDVYNNNTDSNDPEGDGTVNNLIEFVKSENDTFTYIVGDTLPATRDDSGTWLGYTFTVDALTADTATITFTKR